MSEQDQAELRLHLARLRQEHSDFDSAIEAMLQTGCDTLQVQRMKKKKLTLKDQILRMETQVIPDIIA
ncbi:MAG: YdcH family protein [Rhizobiaceae bacterium]